MNVAPTHRPHPWLLLGMLVSLALAARPGVAQAQTNAEAPETAPAAAGDSEGGPSVRDSSVGYIDSALIENQLRLRFDAAYFSNRPNRAELFYPKGAPLGPGLPRPSPRVDYQELNSYVEVAGTNRLSGFVEAPVRFLHPELNAPATGFGDLNAGFKWAMVCSPDWLATFQLRSYFPTGDSHRGLGTDHFSLEPALLANYRFSDALTLESELRYWVPVDGTDFAGDILRYGVGLTFGKRCPVGFWATPVTEVVGWTVLGGKETVVLSPTLAPDVSARGDTIVNAKVGLRFGWGERTDIYTGYGRALTGDVWYKDTWRVELRVRF
jgi:hypothetical protein